ncbi:OX2R protein, partial [Amia calva]|nr:OX2R protein [Amia calva]
MSAITLDSGCEDCSPLPQQLNRSVESQPDPTIDGDDELLKYIWREYLHPKQYEWVLIAGYIVVFFLSLIGNTLGKAVNWRQGHGRPRLIDARGERRLARVVRSNRRATVAQIAEKVNAVCFAVWKNHHMRTVTNYFIVNLSFADVLVTITCLPASLVVDITETWFFGQTLCKVLPYLQTISVSVSVLTLSCIALDRWYAICHPLMFKSTAKRARKSIVIIWIVSCVIMIPQAIVMECSSMVPELTNKTSLFTVCDENWGAEIYPKVYHLCFFIVTYLAPLCLMVLAYIQIFHKLWCRQIPGTSSVVQRKWRSLQCSSQPSAPGASVRIKTNAVAAEIKQIRARRKTARMLMVVLFVFALCYLPISILNILKRVIGTFDNTNNRETVYAWFTFSHWLIYANSAANPIIYNFLSEHRSSRSCSDVAKLCLEDEICNRELVPHVKACSESLNQCNVSQCQRAVQLFYDSLPSNVAEILVFCDCSPSDDKCLQVQGLLHSQFCSGQLSHTPTCLEVFDICIEDIFCRHRYKTFQDKCWGAGKLICDGHMGDDCSSYLDEHLMFSGEDACKAAFTGTMGTILQHPCTCYGLENAEELKCKQLHNVLHNRSHFGKNKIKHLIIC